MNRMDKIISDVAYVLDSLRALRNIYQTGDCNTCANKECQHKPKTGQMVRFNCYDYKPVYKNDIIDSKKIKVIANILAADTRCFEKDYIRESEGEE